MEGNKYFDIDDDGSCEDDIKKLVDKFLTIKEVPQKHKQKLHFEKMLEAFRDTEDWESGGIEELSDEEMDLVSAAGAGRPGYEICPCCQKLIRRDLIEKHKLMEHRKP